MNILAIETSCDETAAAILKAKRGRLELAANVVSSQINIHKKYGGVVPEVAARHHLENIIPVIDEAVQAAQIKPAAIDFIATTAGPGLVTALLVGIETAKALSYAWNKPLIPVNHMYAHLAANFFNQSIQFPALALIVSGGHTEIVLLKNHHHYNKIGQTVDDAVGEAYDKAAKLLNLGYPGGPIIARLADKFSGLSPINLPRPMINSRDFNFSFSGLKTALLYTVQKMTKKEIKTRTPEICRAFQNAAVEVLVSKTIKAAKKYQVQSILLAGGVAANKKLRADLKAAAEKNNFQFRVPEFKLCTDNAAMIAIAGYYLSRKHHPQKDGWQKISADPNWEL
ncbi:MAG TPA: tRNA (adenosine(37)-N6)-threonylcarbamoyltransferase complex transferase subunit TsaD [bacterium]|nr:tRNA (adenosine(37)-N6)-threonylcarbamoyltransferase complex transferase subunit TsaD [bacterium]HNS33924.1 tRNA (adenosine(37)-N6)-threonylcarbamoyltransferase complex transferase subunit TsaD [bacterium]